MYVELNKLRHICYYLKIFFYDYFTKLSFKISTEIPGPVGLKPGPVSPKPRPVSPKSGPVSPKPGATLTPKTNTVGGPPSPSPKPKPGSTIIDQKGIYL